MYQKTDSDMFNPEIWEQISMLAYYRLKYANDNEYQKLLDQWDKSLHEQLKLRDQMLETYKVLIRASL